MILKKQTLKVALIKVYQIIILLPFKYNFKTKTFIKSNFMFVNGIAVTAVFLIIAIWEFYECKPSTPVARIKIVTTLCFFTNLTLTVILLVIRLFLQTCKSSELLNMFQLVLIVFQNNISKDKNYIFRKISIYFAIDFIILPILMLLMISRLVEAIEYRLRINLLIVMIIYIWSITSLFPLYVAFEIFLCSIKCLNAKIEMLLRNLKNDRHLQILIKKEIDDISVYYFKIIELINKFSHFYQFNIMITLLVTTFTIIRKAYMLITSVYQNGISISFSLPPHALKYLIFDFIVNALVFIKLLSLLVHKSYKLQCENTATKLILRSFDEKPKQEILIDTV